MPVFEQGAVIRYVPQDPREHMPLIWPVRSSSSVLGITKNGTTKGETITGTGEQDTLIHKEGKDIMYDKTSEKVWYDANGNGSG